MSEEDRDEAERLNSARALFEKRRAQQRARTSGETPEAAGTIVPPAEPVRPEPPVPALGEGTIGFSQTFIGQLEALREQSRARAPRPTGEIELGGETDLAVQAAPDDRVVEAEVERPAIVEDTPADHELVATPSPQPSPIEGEGESGRYLWTEEDRARVEAEREAAERAAAEAVPQAAPHELSGEAQKEAATHLDAAIQHLHKVADQIAAEPEPQKPALEIVTPQPAPVAPESDTQPSPVVLVASTADGGQPVELPVQDHEARLAALEREEQEEKLRKARELEKKEHAEILKRAAASREHWEKEEAARHAKREAEAASRLKHSTKLAKEQAAYAQALEGSIEDMLTSEQTTATLALARHDHKDNKSFRSSVTARLGSQRNALWFIALLLLVMLMVQIATFRRVGNLTGATSQASPVLERQLTDLRGEITKLGQRLPQGWKMECRLARLMKDGEETYVYQGCFPVPEGMGNTPNPGPAPHGEAEVSE